MCVRDCGLLHDGVGRYLGIRRARRANSLGSGLAAGGDVARQSHRANFTAEGSDACSDERVGGQADDERDECHGDQRRGEHPRPPVGTGPRRYAG
jgi:hypothetical protein